MVLNTGPLDRQSSALTTRPLLEYFQNNHPIKTTRIRVLSKISPNKDHKTKLKSQDWNLHFEIGIWNLHFSNTDDIFLRNIIQNALKVFSNIF